MTIPFICRSARAQELSPLPEFADRAVGFGIEAERMPDTLLRRDPRSDLLRMSACRSSAGEVDIRACLKRCR